MSVGVKKQSNQIKTRIWVGCIAAPPVLLIISLTNKWPIGILLLVIFWIAGKELEKILSSKDKLNSSKQIVIGRIVLKTVPMIALFTFKVIHPIKLLMPIIFAFIAGLFCVVMVIKKYKSWIYKLGSQFWILMPLIAMFILHIFASQFYSSIFFFSPIWLLLLPIWAGDSAALFVGHKFGKTKLAPSISPKKTWEGSIANLMTCIIFSIALAPLVYVSIPIAILCGLMTGIFGQMGDLFESALKRSLDIKDSGSFLPGHGGLLDRIDSMLFASIPVCTVLILYINTH